jgi:hypothetical protein
MITREKLKASITAFANAWGQIGTVGIAAEKRGLAIRLASEVETGLDEVYARLLDLEAQYRMLGEQTKRARAEGNDTALSWLQPIADAKLTHFQRIAFIGGSPLGKEPQQATPPVAEARREILGLRWDANEHLGLTQPELKLVAQGWRAAMAKVLLILNKGGGL